MARGCVAGGMHGGRGACVVGACMVGGACVVGVCVAGEACMAGKTAIAAGGMHPTGMYSCVVHKIIHNVKL